MGLALGQAGQLPQQQGLGLSGITGEFGVPGNRGGPSIFPELAPLNAAILMGKGGKDDFLKEMERLVMGLDDGLGAVQSGLKQLKKARSKVSETVVEGDE